jgi:hypothetical protein
MFGVDDMAEEVEIMLEESVESFDDIVVEELYSLGLSEEEAFMFLESVYVY